MQAVLDRINATGQLLRAVGVVAGTDAVADEQQRALLQHIGDLPVLTTQQGATVAAAAASMPWAETLTRPVLEAIMAKVGTSRVVGRRGMQNYTAVLEYFTEAMWARLQGTGSDMTKMELMFQHVASLGMRNPSEPTIQILSCMWAAVSLGVEQAETLSMPIKRGLLLQIKTAWNNRKRRLPTPAMWINELPLDPRQFAHQFPGYASQAWRGDAPVSCKIPQEALQAMKPTFMMRDRGAAARRAAATEIALPPPPPSGGLEQLATVLPQLVQTIAMAVRPPQPQQDYGGSSLEGLPGLQLFRADTRPMPGRRQDSQRPKLADERPWATDPQTPPPAAGAQRSPPTGGGPETRAPAGEPQPTPLAGEEAAPRPPAAPEAQQAAAPATALLERKMSVDDVLASLTGAMASRKRTRITGKRADPAGKAAPPPAMKKRKGPMKGAPKPPGAASGAEEPCTIQRNYTRGCIIVKFGKGPGSTKSLSFGPGSGKRFATGEEAEAEAERLVRLGNTTGARPW